MQLTHLKELNISPWFFHPIYLKSLHAISKNILIYKESQKNSLTTNHLNAFSTLEERIQKLLDRDDSIYQLDDILCLFKDLPYKTFLTADDFKKLIETQALEENSWYELVKSAPNLKEFLYSWVTFHRLLNPLHIFEISFTEESVSFHFQKGEWSPFPSLTFQLEWIYFCMAIKNYLSDFTISSESLNISSTNIYSLSFPKKCMVSSNELSNVIGYQASLNSLRSLESEVTKVPLKYISSEVSKKVINELQKQLPVTMLSIDEVSKNLHYSKRTLQRKLEQENVQFSDLKRLVRKIVGHQLLTTTTKSVAEISEELGFSEPAAFNKFFKEWTGVSPVSYRKNLL